MPFESTVGKSDLVIGQEYFGSIVRKVKQEVNEKDGKYRIKRFVHLKSGVILVEEYIRTTTAGKVVSKEYGGGPLGNEEPKDDSELRAKARALMAARTNSPKSDKKKKKKKKKEVKKPKVNLDELYDVPAKALPFSELPPDQTKGTPIVGAWKHSNGTDDTGWKPMDVVITEDEPAFLDIDEPHGIVCLRNGALPDKDGLVDPFDLKFFPPGEEEPSFGFCTIGHWTPAKKNEKWPPVEGEPKYDHPPVKKLKLPDLDGEFAKVVPESQLPETQDADAPLTGVWKYDDGTNDDDWEPIFVDITKNSPSNLCPGEPHGIVAVEDGVEADDDGNLDPSDLKFFTPGKDPPSNFNKLGHWKPSKLNQEWPPKQPKLKKKSARPLKLTLPDFDNVDATIIPRSKLPRSENDRPDNNSTPLTGVWEHRKDVADFDWEPMDVVITEKPPLFLEKGEPNGLVAIPKDAKPNRVGRLDPADLNFFTPGEKVPSGSKKVGHWRPGKLKNEWPPKKPILPDFNGPAKVLPDSKAPSSLGEDDPTTGVWEHNKDVDDSEWEPMDVEVSEDYPSDLEPDEPHGRVAVEDGVKPETTGKLKASDLKFFTPGEEPPPAYNNVGHWRPKKLNQEWPPVKKKVPNFDFDGPAWIMPKSKAPDEQDDDTPLTGVWKHNDDTNDNDWDPVYGIISKEPAAFLEPGEPHGLVAVEEDVEPNIDGTLNPSDICFFKPGEKPPQNYKKVGHWRPGKLNQEWPPVKPKLPDFDGPAKVSPRSKAPYKQLSGAPLSGVWKHNDDTDDTEWDPMDVYISKEKPDPAELERGEPHGIVAVDKDAAINNDGTLDPKDISFFTPEEEPPPAFNKVGHWRPGKLKQDWPPKKKGTRKSIPRVFEKPKLPFLDGDIGRVVPKSKAHEKSIKDPPIVGVWEQTDDFDDSSWEPITVIISNEAPSDVNFHGIVAAEEGVETDSVGKLDPADLKFFTPGEEPPPAYTKLGHWTPAIKTEWPLPESKASKARKKVRVIGKLNLPDFEGIPETGVIYPRSQAPESHDASTEQVIAKGIWKWSEPRNKPETSESWMPSKVDLFEDGNEPHDWDDNKEHGYWGVNPDVDEGVNTKPTDLWFYPPKEEPDEYFEPIGKWRPSKKAEWSYPPKPIGKVEDTRKFKEFTRSQNSVGKLRMPSFFKGK